MLREKRPPVEIEAELSVPSLWRGWGWPESVTVRWEEDGIKYRVKGMMTDDGPVLAEVHMTGDIQPDHLRGPFFSIMRNAFAKAALGEERLGGGYSKKSGVRVRVPVGNGRPIDPHSARQRLPEVAKIWNKTPRGQKGKAVADYFGVQVGYAHVLITEARKKGMLDE